MATKREDPNAGPSERPAAAPTESTEASAPRLSEAGRQAVEQGMRQSEQGGRQMVNWGRRATDYATDQARRQAEGATRASAQSLRDIGEMSRGEMDAVAQSGQRLAQGFQEMTQEVTNVTQQSLRRNLQLANQLLQCRSLEDWVSAQRDYMRESLEVMVSGSARLLSLSGRLANDAIAPLGRQVEQSGRDMLERLNERREMLADPPRRRESDAGREVRH